MTLQLGILKLCLHLKSAQDTIIQYQTKGKRAYFQQIKVSRKGKRAQTDGKLIK